MAATNLGGGNGPDLVVVRSHEDVGETLAIHTQDPVIEILRLAAGDASLQGGVDEIGQTRSLVFLGQHGDVVLEGVRDPDTLVADIGDSLVGEPVIFLRKGLVNAVVEVLVVGEDNVATDIV